MPVFVISIVLIYVENTRFMCVIGSCMSLYFQCTWVFVVFSVTSLLFLLRIAFINPQHECLLFSSSTLVLAFLHHSQHKDCLFSFIFIISHGRYYAFLSQPILSTSCWKNKETFFQWQKLFPPSSAVSCLQSIFVCWANFFECPIHLEPITTTIIFISSL